MTRRSPSPRSPITHLVSINRYLSRETSKGPAEDARGVTYTNSNLDVIFLLHLLKDAGSPLRSVACIPDWTLCAEKQTVHYDKVCKGFSIRAGIIITDLWTQPKLWLPPGWKRAFEGCRGRRFIVCNLGLYYSSYEENIEGHANALIFDTRHQIIERFDPEGRLKDRHDDAIERLFRAKMPGWKYVGTTLAAPPRGIQEVADAFGGLCVTFSLMYALYRLSNQHLSSAEVQVAMMEGTPRTLRRRALRLNKAMMDVAKRVRSSH